MDRHPIRDFNTVFRYKEQNNSTISPAFFKVPLKLKEVQTVGLTLKQTIEKMPLQEVIERLQNMPNGMLKNIMLIGNHYSGQTTLFHYFATGKLSTNDELIFTRMPNTHKTTFGTNTID